MCDLEKLTFAIQEMPNNYGAVQFVTELLEKDRIQFIKYLLQIMTSLELPDSFITNSITLISVCLRPTISRPINSIIDQFDKLSEDERKQMKEIILQELKKDTKAKHELAYCFYLIFEIEKAYQKGKRVLNGRKSGFSQYVLEPLQNKESRNEQIGAVILISEIFQQDKIIAKLRDSNQIIEPLLTFAYSIFENLNDLNQDDIDNKIECAKCIYQLLKAGLFGSDYARNNQMNNLIYKILLNCQIPCYTLHKYLCKCLTYFTYLLYADYKGSIDNKAIIPYIKKIYQETIQPVAVIQSPNFDLEKTELFALNVMKIWLKFSKCELEYNCGIPSEFQLNLTSSIAGSMDEYLFSFISTLQVENLLENNISETISYFAYLCLNQFAKSDSRLVFEHANQVYKQCIQSESDNKSILIAIIAVQIVLNIDDLSQDIIFQILNDLINFTQSKYVSVAFSAYAAIITALSNYPILQNDTNFFNAILQSIYSSLQTDSNALISRALSTFIYLLKPYDRLDEDSILNKHCQYIMGMLMNVSHRQELIDDCELECNLYNSISIFISKLPLSTPNNFIETIGNQIHKQMEILMNDHTISSLQLRVWFSIIVYGITEKLQNEIKSLAPNFLTILIATWNEINAVDADLNSQRYILIAISLIIKTAGKTVKSFVPQLLTISLNGLKNLNIDIKEDSACMISHLFGKFETDLNTEIPVFYNALVDCLYESNNESTEIPFVLNAICSVLSVSCEQQSMIEVLTPKSEILMNTANKIIKNLQEFDKKKKSYMNF